MNELLFSYGILQEERVQLKLYNRIVIMTADRLIGFEKRKIEITDTDFLSRGENKYQTILIKNPGASPVNGMVLELTEKELALTDAFEPVNYKRVNIVLESGKKAWLYMAH
jgi:gamma-glutamylcyclotransferase (GGCT)/AIG2-like uncharacterized protein YtfP